MYFRTFILIILVFTSLLSFRVYSDAHPSEAVKVTTIKKMKMSHHIVAYGNLEARAENIVSLSLAHAGQIEHLWIRLGQRVKKGDRLAEIITSPEARMQYFQAKNSLKYADQQLARSKRMFSEKLATKAEVENAIKNLADSQSVLDALIKRNKNRSKEILFSPLSGIITQLNLTLGQRVRSNDSAMLIASENNLVARVGVEPEELVSIATNTPVIINPVFDKGVQIESKIIDINGMVNPSTHLIDAIIDIPAIQAKRLILGTSIEANFIIPEQLYFAVPRSAILNDSSGYFIFTLNNNIAHKIYVRKIIEQNDMVGIAGDFKKGETVVILGNYVLKDGMLTRELE